MLKANIRPLEIPALQPLAFNENGAFKILQLADLHFTNEYGKCRDVPPDVSVTKKKRRNASSVTEYLFRWNVMAMPLR